jgi:putative Mg2+ transporter-C (MgtC) family protein
MTTAEMIFRLLAAAAVGAAFGLNRDLHSKATGVRTLGLVGLGSAFAVIAASQIGGPGDVTRVIQGIVTGIGFLGVGTIVRPPEGSRVHGLTTAATTWLTACIGCGCGVADWRAVAVATAAAFILLAFGGRFEKTMRRYLRQDDDAATPGPP